MLTEQVFEQNQGPRSCLDDFDVDWTIFGCVFWFRTLDKGLVRFLTLRWVHSKAHIELEQWRKQSFDLLLWTSRPELTDHAVRTVGAAQLALMTALLKARLYVQLPKR